MRTFFFSSPRCLIDAGERVGEFGRKKKYDESESVEGRGMLEGKLKEIYKGLEATRKR